MINKVKENEIHNSTLTETVSRPNSNATFQCLFRRQHLQLHQTTFFVVERQLDSHLTLESEILLLFRFKSVLKESYLMLFHVMSIVATVLVLFRTHRTHKSLSCVFPLMVLECRAASECFTAMFTLVGLFSRMISFVFNKT